MGAGAEPERVPGRCEVGAGVLDRRRQDLGDKLVQRVYPRRELHTCQVSLRCRLPPRQLDSEDRRECDKRLPPALNTQRDGALAALDAWQRLRLRGFISWTETRFGARGN